MFSSDCCSLSLSSSPIVLLLNWKKDRNVMVVKKRILKEEYIPRIVVTKVTA